MSAARILLGVIGLALIVVGLTGVVDQAFDVFPTKTVTIAGQVVDSSNAQPIAGATVQATVNYYNYNADFVTQTFTRTTSATGAYSILWSCLSGSSWNGAIHASKTDYVTSPDKPVNGSCVDATYTINFSLVPTGTPQPPPPPPPAPEPPANGTGNQTFTPRTSPSVLSLGLILSGSILVVVAVIARRGG